MEIKNEFENLEQAQAYIKEINAEYSNTQEQINTYKNDLGVKDERIKNLEQVNIDLQMRLPVGDNSTNNDNKNDNLTNLDNLIGEMI